MNITKQRQVGGISNYYGGLNIGECEGHFYWSIEDWNDDYWEEIPESLYRELIKLEERK